MKFLRQILVYTLVVTMAFFPAITLADDPVLPGNSGSGSAGGGTADIEELLLEMDITTVSIMEENNCTLEFGGGDGLTPFSVVSEPTDTTAQSDYVFHATSLSGEITVLFRGGSANGEFGAYWLTATSVAMSDAEDLVQMMQDRGLLLSAASPKASTMYCSASPIMRRDAPGFWEGYWHYLTNPSEMDDDLEIAFYGAMGTAAVAGTLAGGVAIWGAAGGSTLSAGVVATSETSVIFTVNGSTFMGTSSGLVGVPTGYYTLGYWTTITGVPILSAEGAIAGAGGTVWISNHPCLSRAIQAFVGGWL